MNLSNLIPENNNWINPTIEGIGWDTFKAFANKVYKRLLNMQIGESIDILDTTQVSLKNRGLFINCVCLFLSEKGNPFAGYQFNETATKFTRTGVKEEKFQKKWVNRLKYKHD